MNSDKRVEINKIYDRIHSCGKCIESKSAIIKSDPHKVRRVFFPNSIESKIIIVLQSLAQNQVRLSGIQFHDLNGEIGKGGQYLEKYLNIIGYSINPNSPIYHYIYTTDIIQCFPGKKLSGNGDNPPQD